MVALGTWWTLLGKEGSQDPEVGREGKMDCSLHMAFGGRDWLGSLQL